MAHACFMKLLFSWSIVITFFVMAVETTSAISAEYVEIPSGKFTSSLSGDVVNAPILVERFNLQVAPVTNGEYLAFVKNNIQWQRGHVPTIFADKSYLKHWGSEDSAGLNLQLMQAVTNVSWFAAQAYCESEGGRLPTWNEWEYVAAADETRMDARRDPEWRARILAWYSAPASQTIADVGGSKNYFGIQNMHGMVWEWVSDFNALLISADSRVQGDPDKLQFCGAGAISLQDKENYAVLMRVALLSSLRGADTTQNLGFRCAKNVSGDAK
jgi:sulfatase modifying factor 1